MRDRSRRSLLGLALALGLGLQLALVPPVAACSCMGPQPMAAYAGDDANVILAGVLEPRDARGYPVTVTQWFKGGDFLTPRIWFDAAGFSGNDGMCGIDPLPAGGQWIFVTYRIEGSENFGMGLCSPHAPLAAPEGQAMLADAIRTFGGTPIQPNATDPPIAPVPTSSDDTAVLIPILIALIAAAGVVLGVFAVVGRRREPPGGPDAG